MIATSAKLQCGVRVPKVDREGLEGSILPQGLRQLHFPSSPTRTCSELSWVGQRHLALLGLQDRLRPHAVPVRQLLIFEVPSWNLVQSGFGFGMSASIRGEVDSEVNRRRKKKQSKTTKVKVGRPTDRPTDGPTDRPTDRPIDRPTDTAVILCVPDLVKRYFDRLFGWP